MKREGRGEVGQIDWCMLHVDSIRCPLILYCMNCLRIGKLGAVYTRSRYLTYFFVFFLFRNAQNHKPHASNCDPYCDPNADVILFFGGKKCRALVNKGAPWKHSAASLQERASLLHVFAPFPMSLLEAIASPRSQPQQSWCLIKSYINPHTLAFVWRLGESIIYRKNTEYVWYR